MYHELTVWSRGIIMDKEARDVSSCIAAAARALGFYADNVSDYVDDPDRTNCLVRRYARFGDSPIVDRFVYENPRPDWVVLVEETIVKAVNFLRGTPDGTGVLVVNSAREPEYLLKFLPDSMRAGGDVMRGPSMVVDALGDGKRAARDIDRLLTAQALTPEPDVTIMPYEGLNSAYFRPALRIPVPLSPPDERRRSQKVEVTLAYSEEQAVAEADRCMSCGVCNGCDNCYIVCPDVSVLRGARENGHYSIRTTYCKGCLVCVQECPTGCLEKVPEMDFDDPGDVTRMETAFAPYDGAHAEQSAFTKQLIEETIAEYDAARRQPAASGGPPPNGHPANGQPQNIKPQDLRNEDHHGERP